MEPEYWKQRWLDDQTGWHKGEVHHLLVEHFPRFELSQGDRIFVPLCGKSLDLVWLAEQGVQVVGCEISEHAIADFFDALELKPNKAMVQELVSWHAGPYTIYEGDYFLLNRTHLDKVRAVYDRASLIALPKEGDYGRKAYIKQMRRLLGPDTRTLLITLDYEQSRMGGPPFSVGYEEVIWHYAYDHIIEFLAEDSILDKEPRFIERGLERLTEWAFMLTRYEPSYAAFSDFPQDF